jgi:hypothetical protein
MIIQIFYTREELKKTYLLKNKSKLVIHSQIMELLNSIFSALNFLSIKYDRNIGIWGPKYVKGY